MIQAYRRPMISTEFVGINRPLFLHFTVRPGLVEDFIAAWCSDDDEIPEGFQFSRDDADIAEGRLDRFVRRT